MSVVVGPLKESGSKKWHKVTGPDADLARVANRTGQTVKPQVGSNPPHVDVPASRIDRVTEGGKP